VDFAVEVTKAVLVGVQVKSGVQVPDILVDLVGFLEAEPVGFVDEVRDTKGDTLYVTETVGVLEGSGDLDADWILDDVADDEPENELVIVKYRLVSELHGLADGLDDSEDVEVSEKRVEEHIVVDKLFTAVCVFVL